MSEAEYLCDRILLLHRGRVIDEGVLDDLLARSGCRNLTDAFLLRSGARRIGAEEHGNGEPMRRRVVLEILRKELTETLRDRRTLMMMIALPVLIYPLLMIGFSKLQVSQREATADRTSRIAVWERHPPAFARRSRATARIVIDDGVTPPEAVSSGLELGTLTRPAGHPSGRHRVGSGRTARGTRRAGSARAGPCRPWCRPRRRHGTAGRRGARALARRGPGACRGRGR